MKRPEDDIVWPLWLWGAQLFPAGFLILFASLRVASKPELQGIDLKSSVALLIGLGWSAFAVAVLAIPPGRRWLIRRWREWGLSAGVALISLALLDATLTITELVPTIEAQKVRSFSYSPGTFTRAWLIPKTVVVDNGEEIHINRRGFRGPEIDPLKIPGVHRLVFLGGSQVFDYSGGGWPKMVGDELQRRGHKVEIINAGVPGHDSTDSLGKLITRIWPLQPDLVVLCNTWNDVKYFSHLTPADPYGGLPPLEPTPREIDWRLHPTGLDQLLSTSSLYRAVRVALIELFVSEEGRQRNLLLPGSGEQRRVDWMTNKATGPRQFALNLRTIAAVSREIGAQLVLCRQAFLGYGAGATGVSVEDYAIRNTGLTLPELKRAFEIGNWAINAVVDEEDLELVDLDAALASEPRFFDDGIHFSPEGSRAVSVVVADALEDILRVLTIAQETPGSGK